MKRIVYITLALLTLSVVIHAQKSSKEIISQALRQGVEAGVADAQEKIGFTDEQSERLIDIELNFLQGVEKINRRMLCNKKKRVKKLQATRHKALQEVLSRSDYIKYDMIQEDRIEPIPVQL